MCKTAHTLILALAATALPTAAAPQVRMAIRVETPELAPVSRCMRTAGPYQDAWDVVLASPSLSREAARERLVALEAELRAEVEERPEDVELRYALTAAIGMRAEYEDGKGQVRAAREAHQAAMAILQLEPDHPGAQHVIGRLHREVLKMSRIKRFLATRVLGASELQGASWDSARSLLEAAAVGDPCRPDHHFALAELYLDRGDVDLATARLRYIAGLDGSTARDAMVIDRAALLLTELAEAH